MKPDSSVLYCGDTDSEMPRSPGFNHHKHDESHNIVRKLGEPVEYVFPFTSTFAVALNQRDIPFKKSDQYFVENGNRAVVIILYMKLVFPVVF